MANFNIIFKYIIFKYMAIVAVCCLLSACLGGTIAQQIARSIVTSIADKSLARAMDVDEDQAYSNRKPTYTNAQTVYIPTVQSASLPQPYQAKNSPQNANQSAIKHNSTQYQLAQRSIQQVQQDLAPSPYKVAIANTAFEQVKPIAEPLPEQAAEVENVIEVVQSSQLVRVELFNLLIGEDKNAVYEQARLMGAASLPKKREWPLWQVATGAIQNNKKPIIFLIPPEFGKLPSGAVTMVELASPGELNVARYKVN